MESNFSLNVKTNQVLCCKAVLLKIQGNKIERMPIGCLFNNTIVHLR